MSLELRLLEFWQGRLTQLCRMYFVFLMELSWRKDCNLRWLYQTACSFEWFFSKHHSLRWKLRIWSPLLKKSLIENFIFLRSVKCFFPLLSNIEMMKFLLATLELKFTRLSLFISMLSDCPDLCRSVSVPIYFYTCFFSSLVKIL